MNILSRFKKQKAVSLSVDVFIREIPMLLEQGRFVKAFQVCSEEVNKNTYYLFGYLLLAECQCYLKNWDKAILIYHKILKKSSMCLGALRGMALVYRNQKRYQKLLEINTMILRIDKADIFTYEENQKLKNVVKETIPFYEEEGSAIVTPTLAEIYFSQGLYRDAYQMYEALSKQYPNRIEFRKKMREIKLSLSTL